MIVTESEMSVLIPPYFSLTTSFAPSDTILRSHLVRPKNTAAVDLDMYRIEC